MGPFDKSSRPFGNADGQSAALGGFALIHAKILTVTPAKHSLGYA